MSSEKKRSLALVIHVLIEVTNRIDKSGLRWPPRGKPDCTSVMSEILLII